MNTILIFDVDAPVLDGLPLCEAWCLSPGSKRWTFRVPAIFYR